MPYLVPCDTSFLIVVIIIIVKPSVMFPGTSIPIICIAIQRILFTSTSTVKKLNLTKCQLRVII